VRLTCLVVITSQLEEAKAFALDQFGCGSFLTPDLAVALKAFKTGADGNHLCEVAESLLHISEQLS
jgi:hypothetical protein